MTDRLNIWQLLQPLADLLALHLKLLHPAGPLDLVSLWQSLQEQP